jgi:hypothetical protein
MQHIYKNYLSILIFFLLIFSSSASYATPEYAEQQYQQLVDHCQRWDKIYGYNARKLYPELDMIWDQHGY